MTIEVRRPQAAAVFNPDKQPQKSRKIAARRRELAEAALATLAELGYARTSLREIAQKSEFTHGVLHYYFADKVDLICCSVRQYKERCAARYDGVLAGAATRDELLESFLDNLAQSMRNDAFIHRLWYDLRSQALFDTVFRPDVTDIDQSLENMIWRVVSRYAELGDRAVSLSKSTVYAAFDGLFQKYLLRHLDDKEDAVAGLLGEVRELLPKVA